MGGSGVTAWLVDALPLSPPPKSSPVEGEDLYGGAKRLNPYVATPLIRWPAFSPSPGFSSFSMRNQASLYFS